MSLARHGVTKGTPSNIPFGAGAWFKNLTYKEGTGWVNFCTEFCQMCYEAPQVTIYYTPKDKTILEGTP